MIRLAGKYGITVFLDPIETGGWLGSSSRMASRRISPTASGWATVTSHFPTSSGSTATISSSVAIPLQMPSCSRWREASGRPTIATSRRSNSITSVRLTCERLAGQPALDATYRPGCRLHLLPHVRPGAQGIQQAGLHPGLHGRGELRVRARLQRTGDLEAPGVLVACSAARQDSSTATSTRGNSSTAGRAISTRPASRSCSTSRSCLPVGRGSSSSPTSDTSSSPRASGVFDVRQRQRQRLCHGG